MVRGEGGELGGAWWAGEGEIGMGKRRCEWARVAAWDSCVEVNR